MEIVYPRSFRLHYNVSKDPHRYMVIVVVSLPYIAYLCASFITLC